MDPALMASEACRRFAAMSTSAAPASTPQAAVQAPGGGEPLLELFRQLCVLDGWAKISMDRLSADPQDARAQAELRRGCEQAARLHPQFTRRLADVLAERPAVKTSITTTGSIPVQLGRTPVEPRP